jgi:hypothetical protein
MRYHLLLYKEGENTSFNHFEDVTILPQPGDIFSYSEGSGPDPNRKPDRNAERYEVLNRRFHIRTIGGSEPPGSEDSCLVTIILRLVEGDRPDDDDLRDESFLAPRTLLDRLWYGKK